MDFQYVIQVIQNGNPCKYWAVKGQACPVPVGGSETCAGHYCNGGHPVAPVPAPPPPPAEVSTVLIVASGAGGLITQVVSQEGFVVGQKIVIEPGTPREEDNEILAFGSMILRYPLKFDHAAGSPVKIKAWSPNSQPVPAPAPAPAFTTMPPTTTVPTTTTNATTSAPNTTTSEPEPEPEPKTTAAPTPAPTEAPKPQSHNDTHPNIEACSGKKAGDVCKHPDRDDRLAKCVPMKVKGKQALTCRGVHKNLIACQDKKLADMCEYWKGSKKLLGLCANHSAGLLCRGASVSEKACLSKKVEDKCSVKHAGKDHEGSCKMQMKDGKAVSLIWCHVPSPQQKACEGKKDGDACEGQNATGTCTASVSQGVYCKIAPADHPLTQACSGKAAGDTCVHPKDPSGSRPAKCVSTTVEGKAHLVCQGVHANLLACNAKSLGDMCEHSIGQKIKSLGLCVNHTAGLFCRGPTLQEKACLTKKADDACSFDHAGSAHDGKCHIFMDAGKPTSLLFCRPDPKQDPTVKACSGKVAGDTCDHPLGADQVAKCVSVTVDGDSLLHCRGVHAAIVACMDKETHKPCQYTSAKTQKEISGQCLMTKVLKEDTLVCK